MSDGTSREHVHREYGTAETPEPLQYYQSDHPHVAERDQHHVAWRRPLLSESECDHDRTMEFWMDGLGGGMYQVQCLDCATVVDDHTPNERRNERSVGTGNDPSDEGSVE